MRYDARHQVGNVAMFRRSSEYSLSELLSNIETRGPDRTERACDLAVESQIPMERKMSSQILAHTDAPRSSPAGSALGTLARHIVGALAAFARRFMNALYESRLRQANQVIRRYRHLIDNCHY